MASSKRLFTNDAGQIFIPMNVDGGSGNASFWHTGKTMIVAGLAVTNFFVILGVCSEDNSIAIIAVTILLLILVNIWVIRRFIIEEKYYLKMHEKRKQFEVAEPSIFWNVNIQNKNILYYLDGKMGVIVKVERDTIVGKDEDFREKHYDAWSEFYRELNIQKLKRVQMNLMNNAGSDPRFKELDKLVIGAKFNDNLKELVEKQIGHIKAKARNTLFEDDYFLIYVDNYMPYEELLQKVHICMGKLMKGAFIGYKILDKPALNELFKSEFKIKYFNEDSASISLYGNVSKNTVAFKIKQLILDDKVYDINTVQEKALKDLSQKIDKQQVELGDINTLDIIEPKKKDTHSIDMNMKEEKESQQEEEIDLDSILYDDTSITNQDKVVIPENDNNTDSGMEDEYIDF